MDPLICVGKSLKILILAIYYVHANVFACCGYFLLWFFDDYCATIAAFILISPGTAVTTSVVVYLLNDVVGLYDELQSWQVAYILWGAFCCLGLMTPEICSIVQRKGEDEAWKVRETFDKFLLYPFGVKAVYAGNSCVWTLPLVSCAPALVGGFIANFIFEERHILECDKSYNVFSNICEENVCCIVISSHDNWINFITKLASSIIAGWGIVKSVGFFITTYGDDGVETEDETKTQTQTAVEMAGKHDPHQQQMQDSDDGYGQQQCETQQQQYDDQYGSQHGSQSYDIETEDI